MANIVNIRGLNPVDDPSYRYKMPLVMGKIEGKGNGIKTVIPNISSVALSLHRHPAEVNKFFGCELGAQTSYNEKDDRAVVNGSHTDAALQGMIHKYVEAFVLCPNCRLPETVYKIKNGCVWHNCAACGAKEMVDMGHKLCTFILAQDKKLKKEKAKKDKKDRKDGKETESKEKSSSGDKDKKKKKKKSKDSDDEKKKDKKDKKKKKKKSKDSDEKKLADGVDDISLDSEAGVDDAGAIELAVQGVQKFMEANPDASPSKIAEEVANQQMASALKSHDKVKIFIQAAITPSFFKEKQIEKYAPIMQKITQGNIIMERHLIGALEVACVEKPKNFPVMLKQFYDEEALEENVILEWAFDGRSEYTSDDVNEEMRSNLRAEAEPFIAWLDQDSDSDSSDSDSD